MGAPTEPVGSQNPVIGEVGENHEQTDAKNGTGPARTGMPFASRGPQRLGFLQRSHKTGRRPLCGFDISLLE